MAMGKHIIDSTWRFAALLYLFCVLGCFSPLKSQVAPELPALEMGKEIKDFSTSSLHSHLEKLKNSKQNQIFIRSFQKARKRQYWSAWWLIKYTVGREKWSGDANRILFQYFLLREIGINAVLYHSKDHLRLYVECVPLLPGFLYIEFEGNKLLLIDKTVDASIYVLPFIEKKWGKYSLDIYPKKACPLGPEGSGEKEVTFIYQSRWGPKLSSRFKVYFNQAYAEMLDSLPNPPYDFVFRLPVSNECEASLLPAMEELTQGLSRIQAVEVLLEFCSRDFPHRSDLLHHRKEVYSGPDQIFFHKWSDCEDRSILLGYLTSRLLGCRAVLISSGDHAALAVELEEKIGPQISYLGRSYTICDPSYRGKDGTQIGKSDPDFIKAEHRIYPVTF